MKDSDKMEGLGFHFISMPWFTYRTLRNYLRWRSKVRRTVGRCTNDVRLCTEMRRPGEVELSQWNVWDEGFWLGKWRNVKVKDVEQLPFELFWRNISYKQLDDHMDMFASSPLHSRTQRTGNQNKPILSPISIIHSSQSYLNSEVCKLMTIEM